MEPAAPGSDRISSVTSAKAVGIDVPGHPAADTFGPTPVGLSRLPFHDSSKFRFGPGKLTRAMDAEEHSDLVFLRAPAGFEPATPALGERRGRLGGDLRFLRAIQRARTRPGSTLVDRG
ncbi:hypothetical protein [Streptomyces mirabilis]|uniref:hypothetical protein n=1 Tax=Streptomyces mirabilis TaxID=68239 RepID=UPI0036E4682D